MKLVDAKKIKILVVEDSPTQVLLLQRILNSAGYDVETAENGVQAIKMVEKAHPTLIISDIVMPDMDGYSLCSKLKNDEKTSSIPVILLTELKEPEDIIKGLACHADNFITKPYNSENLLLQIEHMIINRKLRMNSKNEMAIEVFFAGKKHSINSDRIRILDLLLSIYEDSLYKKRELEITNQKLLEALANIKKLEGILPICANCKKIRDDKGAWAQIEEYFDEHTDASFSHGICPECMLILYPEYTALKDDIKDDIKND